MLAEITLATLRRTERALGPAAAAFLARLGAEIPSLYELPIANSRGEDVGTIGVE